MPPIAELCTARAYEAVSWVFHNAVRCDLTDIMVWKLTPLLRITQSGREKKNPAWNANAKSSEWTDKLLIQWFRSVEITALIQHKGSSGLTGLVHQGLKID